MDYPPIFTSMKRKAFRDKMASSMDHPGRAHYQFRMAIATATSSSDRWQSGPRAVGVWLIIVALIIVAMVTLGGLTRLTGSGLSITEWRPVAGVVPPLTGQEWQAEFASYQHIPQYIRENRWMSLADFKTIYWWEWTHRLLGRLLGFAFIVPFGWFVWKGAIRSRDWPRMVLIFALGGLQGFIGWWMVQSGLETRISVSQYRLAIHLGAAILLLGAVLWSALEYLHRPINSEERASRTGWRWAAAFVGLVYAQMLLGALVAGLRAGLIYNTWPSMDGRAFPEGAFFSKPWWINFFENPGLVQFDHRAGAYLVTLSAMALWFAGRRAKLSGMARVSSTAVLHMTLLQVALGIVTLVTQAPLALAALHQLAAAALFCTALWHTFERRYAIIA
jgi:cytochrome c oxidase assembly protein subunit 15